MSTITITFRGVAIGYKKGEVWKVLFPFNSCHTVKFLVREPDTGEETLIDNFGNAGNRIDLQAGAAVRNSSSPIHFDPNLYDLTSAKTHGSLVRANNWSDRGVVLTLGPAEFSVVDYLQDPDPYGSSPWLTDGKQEWPIERLVHSVKATLVLEDGDSLNVISEGSTKLTTGADSDHDLIFDNDCPDLVANKNDMHMFYQVVEDGHDPSRRFWIKGKGSALPSKQTAQDIDRKKPRSNPPNLAGGKPCLFVVASSAENLPE
jgi:hypothetical protein